MTVQLRFFVLQIFSVLDKILCIYTNTKSCKVLFNWKKISTVNLYYKDWFYIMLHWNTIYNIDSKHSALIDLDLSEFRPSIVSLYHRAPCFNRNGRRQTSSKTGRFRRRLALKRQINPCVKLMRNLVIFLLRSNILYLKSIWRNQICDNYQFD